MNLFRAFAIISVLLIIPIIGFSQSQLKHVLRFRSTELIVGYRTVPLKKSEEFKRYAAIVGVSFNRRNNFRDLSYRYNIGGFYAPDLNIIGTDTGIEMYWLIFGFMPSISYYHSGEIKLLNFSPRIGISVNFHVGGFSMYWSPQVKLINVATQPDSFSNLVINIYFF